MLKRTLFMCAFAALAAFLPAGAKAGVIITDGKVKQPLQLTTPGEQAPDVPALSTQEQQLYLFTAYILYGHDAASEGGGSADADGEVAGEDTTARGGGVPAPGCQAVSGGSGLLSMGLGGLALLWRRRSRRVR
jgi:uncharacterized protein (TIGR03382 family)